MNRDEMTRVGCQALRSGVGVRQLANRAHVDATDRHRARFIHNMSTCDINGLSAGDGAFGLTVDRGGKLVGQFFADVDAEVIRIEMDAARRETIVAHWESHRVADMIRFTQVDGLAVIALAGPRTAEVLDALCAAPSTELGPLAWMPITLAGVSGRLRRNDERLGLPGWDVTVDQQAADGVVAALSEAGAVAVNDAAWTAVRVADGVPVDRVDMNEENIPLESDHLVRAISWEKGCYIGQEVIARMHYRGKPNRHLRGLEISGSQSPSPGDVLVAEAGKEVGVVGTVSEHSEQGGVIALAVVKRHFAEPGTPLTTAGGAEAIVVALPFDAPQP